jgi:molybdenum cofactor synthesis domain-containing protein
MSLVDYLQSQPNAAILIIGDEILSGRTQDTNSNFLAKKLTEVGINLSEVRVVPDSNEEIVFAVNNLRSKYTYVFTSGGIGPTHDDITADAIAQAFEVEISVNEDAKRILSSNYIDGEKSLNKARLRMARIPNGASLIDNPISKAPGFFLNNVYVMAGVPPIFKAMVESIIPTLVVGSPLLSISVKFFKSEGDIAKGLEDIATKFSDVSIGSYPFSEEGVYGTNVVARHFNKKILNIIENELKELH